MNRIEFIETYAEKYGTTKKAATEAVENTISLLGDVFKDMEDGENLTFYGFGTFKKKHYNRRVAGNIVAKKGSAEIPEHSKIVFKEAYIRKENRQEV